MSDREQKKDPKELDLLISALGETSELDEAALDAAMRARGVDPDATVSALLEVVARHRKSSRLAWMQGERHALRRSQDEFLTGRQAAQDVAKPTSLAEWRQWAERLESERPRLAVGFLKLEDAGIEDFEDLWHNVQHLDRMTDREPGDDEPS